MFSTKSRQFLRILLIGTILSFSFIELVSAQPSPEVASNSNNTEQQDNETNSKGNQVLDSLELSLVGEGAFKVAFWKIYNIELLAPKSTYNPSVPFALKLTYSRKLKGELIAKKSLELIARQGVEDEILLERWEQELIELIPNVEKGDELLGVKTEKGMQVYFNNELLSSTDERHLADYFFNIWLGEDTTKPNLRKKLLGH